jgi:hypothetical protein
MMWLPRRWLGKRSEAHVSWLDRNEIDRARAFLLPGEEKRQKDRMTRQVYNAEKHRKKKRHRYSRFPMVTTERKPDRLEMNW